MCVGAKPKRTVFVILFLFAELTIVVHSSFLLIQRAYFKENVRRPFFVLTVVRTDGLSVTDVTSLLRRRRRLDRPTTETTAEREEEGESFTIPVRNQEDVSTKANRDGEDSGQYERRRRKNDRRFPEYYRRKGYRRRHSRQRHEKTIQDLSNVENCVR